ncbi:Outer membrane protein OmpA [Acidocella aminolytica 101 = DSM 11237]|nr:Outer membrane protein OmpA [Acidocella aminolytica 101 = DSM 11237]
MKSPHIASVACFVLALWLAASVGMAARAQYFSNRDGYTSTGAYRVQVEVDPYFWWPGFAGSVNYATPIADSRMLSAFNTGLLSPIDIAHILHAAFIGDGLVRYGPYSAEMDLQYISVSQSQDLPSGPLGDNLRLKSALQLLRIAPGFGYQVYAGNVYGVPTSVDARAGFSFFSASQSYTGEEELAGRSSTNNTNFVQPWIGTRADFIPGPRWRIELAALVQGFGVDGGSWGWGASGTISYAVNDWLSINLAARALDTERLGLSRDTLGVRRSLHITTYGPIFGVGFRFPRPLSSPPAPTAMPTTAPAPLQAKTYLVFFDWDEATLTPRASRVIAQAAADSRTNQVTRIEVDGYTNTSGRPPYNRNLSISRAKVVEKKLISYGVPASEIAVRGFGDTKLLAHTGANLRDPQNRRVEIVIN